MTFNADRPDVLPSASHLMRHALHELERVRAQAARDAEELSARRNEVRRELAELDAQTRAHVQAFAPKDLGQEMRLDLKHRFGRAQTLGPDTPAEGSVGEAPATFDAARDEWNRLAKSTEAAVSNLLNAMTLWESKRIKRRRNMPTVPDDVWRASQRLSDIHRSLPDLREQFALERLDSKAHLNRELNTETERRAAALDEAYRSARAVMSDLETSVGLAGGSWSHPAWHSPSPTSTLDRSLRIGEFDPGLPTASGIGPIPALLDFPLAAGVAIATDVDRRSAAIELARSLVLRSLAATPPGDARFVFIDPVSLGQSVADFRHLAEFDARLVDAKTWTTERDIERRLEELSDHLEVVISTYLRGQYESIDAYNLQAGEVAEPYRTIVIFDYPTGFTSRSARQLLSLIENGTRCGVHVVLVYDPSGAAPDDVPTERLVHSMQRINLTRSNGVALPEPIGRVNLTFLPDASPDITFSPDGRATSPAGQFLLDVGAGARKSETGPVTLDRVFSIINKQVASGRSSQAPELLPGSSSIDVGSASTWWSASTARGAHAAVGRSGAQDVAAMFFSSTEIAGGAIIVGLPRSGKSTALHAAILSLSLLYSPAELELYLVDSKHGVEFKIYDRLPHARQVSINSEREFSVSVLASLDSEIKRRADLMKSRTAGRANITEYRAATGDPMPRIVLFMDEFHEVFEEDDSIGQAAFKAFSNIVRQGPFAGVHIVVSSQTLSSMPAMDRGTLSLLPMRIAFMCNESDADLVMGDTNREVRALNQQGEGIFNAARGDTSHNKPFRGTYVDVDSRDALLAALVAKAREEGWERSPRVFDGDRLAVRPATRVFGTATRPTVALGEPFNLDDWAGVSLRRGRGANVLIVGASDEDDRGSVDESIEGAMHSCLVDAAASGLEVRVVDFIGDAGDGQPGLDLMALASAFGVPYRRPSSLSEVLSLCEEELVSRREAAAYDLGGHLLLLHGLQRALDLAPEDPYADAEDSPALRAAVQLARLLREGPEVGIHTLVTLDRLTQFDRRLGRDMLREFDWRIIGSTAAPQEIQALAESYSEAEIRPSQLMVLDHGRGRGRRVRAYAKHTETSVASAITTGDT